MTVKPILFSGPMVRAITTRRENVDHYAARTKPARAQDLETETVK